MRAVIKSLSFALLIAGSWFFVGHLAYAELPQMLNSGLDNDHLIVFDHWHQLFDGTLWPWEWVFSRLPSFFPDYGIGFGLALGISPKQVSDYLAIHWIVQFALAAGLLIGLTWVCARSRNRLDAVLVASLTVLVATSFVPGFRFSLMMTGLPVNHGGNVVNVFLALGLVVAGFRSRLKSRRALAFVLFAFGLLAGFSNRMFLLQFLLPFGLALLLSGFGPECRRYFSLLAAGALVGGVLIYGLVIHQCADPSAGEASSRWIAAAAGLQMLWETGTWLVFGVGLLGACCLLLRGNTSVEALFMAFFYVFFVLLSLVVFLLLVPDSGSVYLRYLLAPLWITPLPVALALSELVQPGYVLIGFALLGLAAIWTRFPWQGGVAQNPVLDARHQWAVEVLRRNGFEKGPVLAVSPAWESRALGLALERPGAVLSVSTDGNPMLWPHAREEYLLVRQSRYAPSPDQIRDFHFYLGSPEEKSLLLDRLGLEGAPMDCYAGRYCLWRLPESLSPLRTQFFVDFFSTQADDRWRCLNTDSNPLKRLLVLIRNYLATQQN